jgi:carbon-monoxide dehydrogenase medium subunit
VRGAFPLAQACWAVGSPQIRNRGTIAGNLITASPANDTITPLWALDAEVTLRGARGERRLSFADFYRGVRQVDLAADELLAEIAFPALPPEERGTFVKIALRKAQAIAVVNAAVVRHSRARRSAGRASRWQRHATIVRAAELEAFLAGRTLDDETVARAGGLAAAAAARSTTCAARPPTGARWYGWRPAGAAALAGGRERASWPERPVMRGPG